MMNFNCTELVDVSNPFIILRFEYMFAFVPGHNPVANVRNSKYVAPLIRRKHSGRITRNLAICNDSSIRTYYGTT